MYDNKAAARETGRKRQVIMSDLVNYGESIADDIASCGVREAIRQAEVVGGPASLDPTELINRN